MKFPCSAANIAIYLLFTFLWMALFINASQNDIIKMTDELDNTNFEFFFFEDDDVLVATRDQFLTHDDGVYPLKCGDHLQIIKHEHNRLINRYIKITAQFLHQNTTDNITFYYQPLQNHLEKKVYKIEDQNKSDCSDWSCSIL